MTALGADVNILRRAPNPDRRMYLVADNVKIYKGGIIVLDSSGYARPARNTATDRVVGIAEEAFDNTITGHAAGGRDALGRKGVLVISGGHFLLTCSATVSQASVGTPFYALDDATARATVGNGNFLGMVSEYVSATSAWVFIPAGGAAALNLGHGALGLLKVAAGQLTTVTATDTVVTGLASVISVVASYETDPADANVFVSAQIGDQAGSPAAGSIIIKTWKSGDGADVTPVAASAFSKKVNWIAVGY